MLFGEKVGGNSDTENTSKRINEQMDQFPFSALHFLRNRLMPSDISQCYNLPSPATFASNPNLPSLDSILPLSKLSQVQSKSTIDLPEYSPSISVESSSLSPPSLGSSPLLMNNPFCNPFARRPRGEKRPIPEEQKDEKYFERRRRNNEAAKKSRDARKMREDRIALRAALLEQENSILRAQTLALREEVCTLRQILCNRTVSAATSTSNLPSITPNVSQS